MTTSVSTWENTRQWLTLFAASASALFAGLIWWLASKRLKTRYSLEADSLNKDGSLRLKLAILNRSDNDILIETISVKPPLGIVVDENGNHFEATAANNKPLTALESRYVRRFKPSETAEGFNFALRRDGGFASCKTVSIRLHILKSRPVIRHKKKVLTATLMAHIRNAKPSSPINQ
jgi:hypothetical protein